MWFLMKVVFDENFFDEIDHFHPHFDETAPNRHVIPHDWKTCRNANHPVRAAADLSILRGNGVVSDLRCCRNDPLQHWAW